MESLWKGGSTLDTRHGLIISILYWEVKGRSDSTSFSIKIGLFGVTHLALTNQKDKVPLIGLQIIIPVTQGKLDLGPWQQLYYAEFDGQRRKHVIVKVIGE